MDPCLRPPPATPEGRVPAVAWASYGRECLCGCVGKLRPRDFSATDAKKLEDRAVGSRDCVVVGRAIALLGPEVDDLCASSQKLSLVGPALLLRI